MKRTHLCLLVAGLLAAQPALGQIRATQTPTKKGLERKGPEIQPQQSGGARNIQPLPAPEVVKLQCPAKLVYYATELEDTSPELRGWEVQPVKPVTPRITLQFGEIGNLREGNWTAATSVDCKYFGEGGRIGGRTQNHYTKLTRKIHPSGTQYRCKASRQQKRNVECRLSITPEF